MKVYVKCDGCGSEGQPEWKGGNPSLYQYSGYFALPAGWTDAGRTFCGDCAAKARAAIDALFPPKAAP